MTLRQAQGDRDLGETRTMIKFERYPHVNDLLKHYAVALNNEDATSILKSGFTNAQESRDFSKFVWQVVDAMHYDEENEVLVLGSTNNIEMIPDLEYEVSSYMRSSGFYNVWLEVSENAYYISTPKSRGHNSVSFCLWIS